MHEDLALCTTDFYLSDGMYFATQPSCRFNEFGAEKSLQKPNMPLGIITGQLKS
jgi:hypothetical protein